jgi:hypothetical protein
MHVMLYSFQCMAYVTDLSTQEHIKLFNEQICMVGSLWYKLK